MFYYRRISEELIHELIETILAGESVILLAPRFGGKRYVLDRLKEALEMAGLTALVSIRLFGEKAISTEQELYELMNQAMAESGIPSAQTEQEITDSFEAMDAFTEQTGKPVVLLATNVDAMAHHLARTFLEKVRVRVEAKQLIVALSGEYDFRDLVHGPKSEFNCSYNYFLQGFAENELGAFLEQYAYTLNLQLASREDIVRHLWEITGGNSYLLRPLIVEMIEKKVRFGKRVVEPEPITVTDFSSLPSSKKIPGTYWTQICRHATRLIIWEPECWDSLEKLIKGESVAVIQNTPTPLEWAGVAIREATPEEAAFSGMHLRFASPMMENYARQHFNDLHFGDLYARNGKWDKAFEKYARLDTEHKRRPLSTSDRSEAEKTLSALGAELFSAATRGLEAVKELFVQGCVHLLGFHEVTFWRHEKSWTLRKENSVPPVLPQELEKNVNDILSRSKSGYHGLLDVPAPWDQYAAAARLKSLSSDYFNAVIVSDMEQKVVISREREKLLKELLQKFVEAHAHAVNVQKMENKLEVRYKHGQVINSIFEAMGKEVTDVDRVLKLAAKELQKMGYKRVLFCLVDPKRERIQGILDYSEDHPRVDVAEMTNYALAEPIQDIQPYIIKTKRPMRIADASTIKLVSQNVRQVAGLKAMAIVPILNRNDEAIGTIHIERRDGAMPSREEVEGIQYFGRQLSTAIEQAERVNLLESALNKIPQPVIIVDPLEKTRYANRAASHLFDIKQGWRDKSESDFSPNSTLQLLKRCIQLSLNGQRTFQHIDKLGKQENYHGAVLSDVITNFRDIPIGAFLHIQELTDFLKVFQAFLKIATTKDIEAAMYAVLDATELLGYRWGRLYLIDQRRGYLVSKRSYGMPNRELAGRFDNGQIKLPEEHIDSWRVFGEGKPMVFRFMPDSENGKKLRTLKGLEYISIKEPFLKDELEKRPQEFWLEIPLMKGTEALGKVTLCCEETLRPEDIELLKVFSKVDSDLLESFSALELERYEREWSIREKAAEKIMGEIAHNLATRFGSFPGWLTLYRGFESQIPELKEVNDGFSSALDHTLTVVKRAKERLAPVEPKILRLNLLEHLERVLKSALPNNIGEVELKGITLEIEADPHLLEMALIELIQNSIDAQDKQGQLQVKIIIEHINHDARDKVKIIYRDNGRGIKEEIKERIFEDFFSHRPEQKKASTGLGMGYVRRVVQAHGGEISVGSAKQGAEFVIMIPRLTTDA